MRSLQMAGLSMVRNKGASVVAIATMAFMLTALGLFIFLASGVDRAAAGLEARANLVADLCSSCNKKQIAPLERALEHAWPGTRLVYVTKAEAAAAFRKTFAGDGAMLAALQGNPLPPSLAVRVRNARTLPHIAALLRHDPRVQHLIYSPNLTRKLVEITTFMRVVGIVLVVGLAFLALVIVVNTVQLAVQARAEEIEVMQLLGASGSFVRNPFICEGVGLGFAGAVVAIITSVGFSLPFLARWLAGNNSISTLALLPIDTQPTFVFRLALLLLVSGCGLGAVGSYISVSRFSRS